jgi:hypothetical protein
MTSGTVYRFMRSKKGKPGLLMHYCYVADHPLPGCMTFITKFSKRLIVDIGMTIQTVPPSIFKSQILMTISTISYPMLTLQLKAGIVVIKFYGGRIYLPAFRCMALSTIDLKRFPMR